MEEKEHKAIIYLTTEELREILEVGRLVVQHKPGDRLALRIYQAYQGVSETPEESH